MTKLTLISRLLLAAAWAILAAITVRAVAEQGLLQVVRTFIRDYADPWRAQIYTDFSIHLLMFAAWILYRSRTLLIGAVMAFLVLSLGALFTLPYVLLASIRARGDPRILLLGRHARP